MINFYSYNGLCPVMAAARHYNRYEMFIIKVEMLNSVLEATVLLLYLIYTLHCLFVTYQNDSLL